MLATVTMEKYWLQLRQLQFSSLCPSVYLHLLSRAEFLPATLLWNCYFPSALGKTTTTTTTQRVSELPPAACDIIPNFSRSTPPCFWHNAAGVVSVCRHPGGVCVRTCESASVSSGADRTRQDGHIMIPAVGAWTRSIQDVIQRANHLIRWIYWVYH